jgi:hypothetical protein
VYRDEREAMRTRIAALEREASAVQELRGELDVLRAENAQLRNELERLRPVPAPPPRAGSSSPRPIAFRVVDSLGPREVVLTLETIKIGWDLKSDLHLHDEEVNRMQAVIENGRDASFCSTREGSRRRA